MLPDLVLAAIRKHQPSGTAPVLLACSGGVDSQVLLHSAAAVWPAQSLWVGHVHHGLQPEADDWLAFCEAAARQLGLPFLFRRLPPLPPRLQGGVEGWARRLRYRALAEMADEAQAGMVLTAHHANDQLETHRLRSLRGAGALGLGAMRAGAPLPGAPGRLLLRPFLDIERRRILDAAQEWGLDWVDDPSNQDLRHARNRVRRDLEQALLRDPGVLERGLDAIGEFQCLADAARRQAAEDLLAARLLLTPAPDQVGPVAARTSVSLSRAALARLPQARAAEALRLWLAESGARMPSRAKLAELMRQLVGAGSPHARLRHDGLWLVRYRDRIDQVAQLPCAVQPTWFRWGGQRELTVGGQQFVFHRSPAEAPAGAVGVDAAWLADADLLLDRGRGADLLRLEAAGPRRTWKNLSQERGVPPWLRPALPVLRRGEAVLHAAPFGTNRDFAPAHAGRVPADPVAIEWLAPSQWARWL